MRRRIAILVAALAAYPVCSSVLYGLPESKTDFLHDRLIIKFASPLSSPLTKSTPSGLALPGRCNEILSAARVEEIVQLFPQKSSALQKNLAPYDLSTIYEIHFGREIDVNKIATVLRVQPGVVYVEPVYIRQLTYDPNDPVFVAGFQNYLKQISAPSAWDISRGDASVVLAIVDTGVDWTHEDLAANIWTNQGEIAGNGIDDDGNGYVDDTRGWDFGGLSGTPDNDPREDRPDHGTHVAGIADAVGDNNTGGTGVAFGCKIMPVKVSQDNTRTASGQALVSHGYKGIVYAADNGADVINLSWGGGGYSRFEQEIIDYATSQGAVIVAAAGNDNSSEYFYPAAYQNVLSVAATNNDARASFSNYGYWVGISAPGQDIYSTWQPSTSDPTNYRSTSGTSMASPVVAGVCALVKSIHNDWSPQQIAQQVRMSADNIGGSNPGYARQLGQGRVNAQSALLAGSSPAVRFTNMVTQEVTGDQDGIYEPGEDVGISFTFTNYLQDAGNLQVTAATSDGNVTITNSTLTLGSVSGGQTVTPAQQIVFHINASAPRNRNVEFLLNMSAAGYADWQPFSVLIRPTSVNLEGGNVALTMSSFGAAGYVDYVGTGALLGLGFQFPIGSDNALYHGGFMLATASTKVSDVSYGRSNGSVDVNPLYDFVTTADGEIRRTGPTISSEEFVSRFDDSGAESPLGVEVTQTMLTWAAPPNDDFVILQYAVRNKSGAQISGLYAGFYLDWDVAGGTANFVGWDAENQLGYEYASGSNYYGICAVSPGSASSYRAVNNPAQVWNNQYTDAEKYQFFSGGFAVVSGTTPDDWSQQIGYGPFTLQPDEEVVVAFALLGGTNLDDIKANAKTARLVYSVVGVDDDEMPIPLRFELSQNVPNPFHTSTQGQTVIAYSLANESNVQVRVFNLLGQQVALLREARQGAGKYSLTWNGRNATGNIVPSGIYFYQVLADNLRLMRRMVVVR